MHITVCLPSWLGMCHNILTPEREGGRGRDRDRDRQTDRLTDRETERAPRLECIENTKATLYY